MCLRLTAETDARFIGNLAIAILLVIYCQLTLSVSDGIIKVSDQTGILTSHSAYLNFVLELAPNLALCYRRQTERFCKM